MTDPRTRILIIEDDRRHREALTELLEGGPFDASIAGSVAEARAALAAARPDVVVCDLGLPDGDGVDLIADIVRRFPRLPVLVLTVATGEARILAALRVGACGYLLKEDLGSRLVPAIGEALAGGVPMSRAVARVVLGQVRGASTPGPTLTARERSIVELLSRGHSYEDVATGLGITVNTVRTHVRSLYDKLEVSSKTEAVMEALRRGFLRE